MIEKKAIVFVKNTTKKDQKVLTLNWKEVVKAWEVFETKARVARSLIRLYSSMFKIVEKKEEVKKVTKNVTKKK